MTSGFPEVIFLYKKECRMNELTRNENIMLIFLNIHCAIYSEMVEYRKCLNVGISRKTD